MFRNLFLSLVILLGMPGAIAEERIALVIGNADYPPEVGRLANTHDDAERIHAALTSVGFRATLVK
ncbi:MAG: caspase family protein, partial [Pseudomonadota bacterium]